MPPNWGAPAELYNYDTGRRDSAGFVWLGKEPATEADIAALKKRFGEDAEIDGPTLTGGPSFRDRHKRKHPYKRHIKL